MSFRENRIQKAVMEEEKIFKSTTAFLLKGVICMKLTYHLCGDYLLPDLTIPDKPVALGKYGRMRKTYLKEHKPILYNALLLSGKLTEYLIGVDAKCRERLEILLPQMMQVEGVDEALKARNRMEWVRRMNSIPTDIGNSIYCPFINRLGKILSDLFFTPSYIRLSPN